MLEKFNLNPFPPDMPGLLGTVLTLDWTNGRLGGLELPIMEGRCGDDEVRELVKSEIAWMTETELDWGFEISAKYCKAFDNYPKGMFDGVDFKMTVQEKPADISCRRWKRILAEAVEKGYADYEHKRLINFEYKDLTVYSDEILDTEDCDEFLSELALQAGDWWPEEVAEFKANWTGHEAELLLGIRSVLGENDPRILRSVNLEMFLFIIERIGGIERFLPVFQHGPQSEIRLPQRYQVNSQAWNKWLEKPVGWMIESKGRLIREIRFNDLVEIFPFKAAFFVRKGRESRFEAVMETGRWATEQQKEKILSRFLNVEFDAVSGELLLNREPTTPEEVFRGIKPGNMTDKDVPRWLEQSRLSKSKRKARKRARLAKIRKNAL